MVYRFSITQEDYDLAKNNMWMDDENVLVGNIGEIIGCKYLGISYIPKQKSNADCGYDIYYNEIKYQVKALKDEPYKKKIFLEKSNSNFDRYLLIIISQDLDWAEVLIDTNRETIENNSYYDDQYKKKFVKMRV